MDDAAKIGRLREEQLRAVEQTKEKIEQLKRYRGDYKALQERLTTLPDKVTHQIMVPFGSLAFMPGQLIHTNEIMVLLGDNWFAQRSAKQACEIIDRRMANVDESIQDLEKQAGLLAPRLDVTERLHGLAQEQSGVVEIKEDYDPEHEKKWMEEHRKRMRLQKQSEKEAPPETAKKRSDSDEDLWARLEELELQESRGRELQRIPDDAGLEPSSAARKVHWGEDLTGVPAVEDSDDDGYIRSSDEEYTDIDDDSDASSGEQEAFPQRTPSVIHFTHTKTAHPTKCPSEAVKGHILSPADAVRHCQTEGPKSILKKTASVETPSVPDVVPTQCPQVSKAFSASVVERSLEKKEDVAESEPPKRMSKFKAQRLQQKR